jgi:hypothetical protein
MDNEQQQKLMELVKILQGHEMRLEYNFSAILQVSMLVEFLFVQLAEKNIEIDMEKFEPFQKERMSELESSYDNLKNNPDVENKVAQTIEEFQKEVKERIKL